MKQPGGPGMCCAQTRDFVALSGPAVRPPARLADSASFWGTQMNSLAATLLAPSDHLLSPPLGASDVSQDSAILLQRLEARRPRGVKVPGLKRDIYVKI